MTIRTAASLSTARTPRARRSAAALVPRATARRKHLHSVAFCGANRRVIALCDVRRALVRSYKGWLHQCAADRHVVVASQESPHNLIEPLTHRNLQGEPYVRTPKVEQQILATLPLGRDEILVRARIADQADPQFLQEETLAYFIRRAHRGADDDLVNGLSKVLVERCTRFLTSTLRRPRREQFEEVIAETVADLFEKLVEPAGSDAGDFLQVRFWVVVKRLGWAAIKRAAAESQRELLLVSIESAGTGAEHDDEQPLEIADPMTPGVDTRLMNDEALSLLEPNVREAFVLKVEGWPVEDRDPNVMTISRHFGKTSRTIRNWIADAERRLAAWRDEEAGS